MSVYARIVLTCIAGLTLAGVVIALAFVNSSAQSDQPAASAQPFAPTTVNHKMETPHYVQLPPWAKVVAEQLKCKDFKELGAHLNAGVIDSGSCWMHGQKYAIDTFASKRVRDRWLQMAEPYGVVPLWMTKTSVTYKSVA
jgi:hypothetical protein